MPMKPQRYLMLTCAVLARECYHCAAASKNLIDLQIIEQGLHDIGEEGMSKALQEQVDAVDPERYDAILMGYGLCSNGIRGLQAKLPVVVPRAHDCITLLMGSRQEYMEYFNSRPGTFFRSVGWEERADSNLSNPQSTTRQMGISSYEDYVEQYGEENAKYLSEILNDHLRNYTRLAYIDSGLPDTGESERSAEAWAQEKGWEYERLQGNMRLIEALMAGDWDEADFLVLQPGQRIEPSHGDDVVKAV